MSGPSVSTIDVSQLARTLGEALVSPKHWSFDGWNARNSLWAHVSR
jgi:hypothetical protein